MTEVIIICIAALVMTEVYSRTVHPCLYAFFNTAAGAVSLAVSEMFMSGSLGGIDLYNSALSVILGLPGTVLHCLPELMNGVII